MTTLWAVFFTSFMVGLSGALMPGPLLTITISESPQRGYRTGPLLIAGHGLLELTLVVALLLGLAPFLQHKAVFIVTAVGGSGVLLWMAFGMLHALPKLSLQGHTNTSDRRNLVITGALLSLANPYWTIWWVSIGLGYILQSQQLGKWGVVSFFSGHILSDLFWYTALSVAFWKGKTLLSDRVYRFLIGGCALFLIVFAGLFGHAGISQISG
jgi:threonine/homoserine/homoserine lactone efflux protein